MAERCAVIGIGQTEHSAKRVDVSLPGLLREAASRALEDARLSYADVDAVVVTHCHLDHTRDVEALVDLNYRFNEGKGNRPGHAEFRELKFFLCTSASGPQHLK